MGMHECILEIFNFILEVREKHYTFVRKGSNMIQVVFGGDRGGICIGDGPQEQEEQLSEAGGSILLPRPAPPETVVSPISGIWLRTLLILSGW